ncbi:MULTISPECIES: S1 family peptidase [unclassified Micromonospora]|uniref:S1 family peptidase n=1 Tax=unclassified Micromonospora TaxID=2617518 RepID=UPI00363C7102
MRRGTNWRLAAAVSLIVAAGSLTVSEAAVAAPVIRLATLAPVQPANVAGSVDYLTRTYGVSTTEAVRRLELQRTAAALQDVLARDHADTFAGSWIDQDNGGVLFVASTAAGKLAPALGAIPDRRHIRVVGVRHSLKDLEARARDVSARLGLTPEQEPVINPRHNRVELHHQAAAAVRGSAGRLALADDLGVTVVDSPTPTPQACAIRNCEAPIRGGLTLDMFDYNKNPKWTCTNGFNVHGSDGWQYTVTAGHCSEDGKAYYSKHAGLWVGRYNYPTYVGQDYPYDGIIMPYVVMNGFQYVTYWVVNPRNTVFNSRVSAQFPIYGMYSYSQIGVGWVACHTGQTSNNTRCGTVLTKDGGMITDICTQDGDSGGPLFSEVDHMAYGILHGGTNSNGTCTTRSYYSPLSKVFDSARSYSGITFNVNSAA